MRPRGALKLAMPSGSRGGQLLRLMWGIHISRCVFAVAELGIADLLAGGPSRSEELAAATGCYEPSLYRVLHLLAALGVFEEHDHRSFSPTAVGERLRSNVDVAMRSWAILLEALGGVRPFEYISETIRTGKPGFDAAFGTGNLRVSRPASEQCRGLRCCDV